MKIKLSAITRATAIIGVLSILFSSFSISQVAPAQAQAVAGQDQPVAGEAGSTITLTGTLAVVPAETGEGFEYPGSVSLITNEGDVHKIYDGADHDYQPGQIATVVFKKQKNGALKPVKIDAVATAKSINKVTARSKAKEHQIDIVYLSGNWSDNKTPKKKPIQEMAERLSNYWKSQSNGQIKGVKLDKLKIVKTDFDFCQQPLDLYEMWGMAAKLNKRNLGSYYTNGKHLIVMTQAADCAGYRYGGVGELGADVHTGGAIWAFVGADPLTWDGIIFHEFGHNTSLWHSDVMRCAAPHTDSKYIDIVWGNPWTTGDIAVPRRASCWVQDYGDPYDVMGGALSTANAKIPALSATQKLYIGAIPASGIKRIEKKKSLVRKAKLYPISGNKNVRTIEIVDPKTGELYYLEYRSGTGRDKNTFYNKWQGPDYGPGVRILRMPDNWHSVLLLRNADTKEIAQNPAYPVNNKQLPYLAAGTSFTADSKSFIVTVKALHGTHASVEIVFSETKTKRVKGANSVAAGVEATKTIYPVKAKTVYLVTGKNIAESFAAVPAAAKSGGPVMIAPQKSSKVTKAFLKRLQEMQPKRIVVVGPTTEIPQEVIDKIVKKLPTVKIKRLKTKDSYALSNAVVKYAFGKDTGKEIYIASGRSTAYAASAAAAAAAAGNPVIYVNGKDTTLPAATLELIASLAPSRIIVVGGTGAVSKGMYSQLKKSYKVKRVAGAGKYTTSAEINKFAFKKLGMQEMHYTSGLNIADTVVAASAAAAGGDPLFLVQQTCIPKRTFNLISSERAKRITLYGKTNTLSNTVRDLTRCR